MQSLDTYPEFNLSDEFDRGSLPLILPKIRNEAYSWIIRIFIKHESHVTFEYIVLWIDDQRSILKNDLWWYANQLVYGYEVFVLIIYCLERFFLASSKSK